MILKLRSCPSSRGQVNVFVGLCFCTSFYILWSKEIVTSEELKGLLTWDTSKFNCSAVDPARVYHADKGVTVVTMYLDLGSFKKGTTKGLYYGNDKYRRWMSVFCKITNPVVAFMETDLDVEYFRSIRSHLPAHLTKVIKVKRKELSSFDLLPQIAAIYADPAYPKHYPNTVNPDYTCSMNAKYDVLERVCLEDMFKTPYVAWVDIGCFRTLVGGPDISPFELLPPSDFDDSAVGYSQVGSNDILKQNVSSIFKEDKVWIGGAVALAKKEVMLQFAKEYKVTVRQQLAFGLSNSDQQIIAAMYHATMKKDRTNKIQTYSCNRENWFCLGYKSREQGLRVIKAGKVKTEDMGGYDGTSDFIAAVLDHME